MGIIMMESFSRFGQVDFDNAGNGAIRPVQTDQEWREWTGYYNVADTLNGTLNASPSYQAVGFYQDPIVPSKTRLGLDVKPVSGSHNNNHAYGLERVFPTPKTKYTVGFLIRWRVGPTLTPTGALGEAFGFEFFAAGRVRMSPSSSIQPRFGVIGGTNSGAGLQAVVSADNMGQANNAVNTISNVTTNSSTPPTFRMGGVTDPNGLGVQLQYENDHFFEVEVDVPNKTLKVWVDDLYCGLVPWADQYHNILANGFQIRLHRHLALNTYSSTTDFGGIYLSDIYCIDNTDGVVPNTRLGKTTRVFGEAPDKDISTMFTPPSGFTSNYDVINDPITTVANPTVFLSGDGVGAEDVYQTANSNIQSFAGTVYGVQIHARFQNASAVTHNLAVTADDGTAKTENTVGNIPAGTGVQMRSVVLNKQPSGAAWTPAAAAALKYGFKIVN